MQAMEYFPIYDDNPPKKGDLLISEPFLADPNFERTVIFLCEHNEEGSFGFILNKRSLLRLDEVLEDLPEAEVDLYVGGPVQQNSLHFLHQASSVIDGGVEIVPGISWGGQL